MKKNQGIFEMWLKNFVSLVFTQSFQAVFLAVSLQILKRVNEIDSEKLADSKQMLCAIVAFIALTGVIKLQKLVKGIFGIGDSPLIGDMSKNMKSVLIAGAGAGRMISGIKSAWGGISEAKSKVGAAQRQIRNVTQNRDSIERMSQNQNHIGSGNSNSGNDSNPRGNGYTREQIANIFSNPANFDSSGNLQNENSLYDQMLDSAATDEVKAKRELEKAKSRAVVKTLSTIAGLGVAIGSSDSIDETFSTGAVLSEGFDAVGNKISNPAVNANIRKRAARELKANNNETARMNSKLENATDEAAKREIEKVKHDMDIINQAIVDSTKDISANVRIKSSGVKGTIKNVQSSISATREKIGKSVREAADDWLNMQVNTAQEDRVKNKKEAKEIITRNRERYKGSKE